MVLDARRGKIHLQVAWYENSCETFAPTPRPSFSAMPTSPPSAIPTSVPSASPTASFLELTSIGTQWTCVSLVECVVTWTYRGAGCSTVEFTASDTDGNVVETYSNISSAPGQNSYNQTVEGTVEISEYTLHIECADDASISDARSISISYTDAPTAVPTPMPSGAPSSVPSAVPSALPTSNPTGVPTSNPTTAAPTAVPSAVPTAIPTGVPTSSPTEVPAPVPTAVPTAVPTSKPTEVLACSEINH